MTKTKFEKLVEQQLINVFKIGMLEGLKTPGMGKTDPIPVLKEAQRNIMGAAKNAKV